MGNTFSTIDELLSFDSMMREFQTTCDPRQRGLISLLAVSHKHMLDTASVMETFADDLPRTALERRRRTRRFLWFRVGKFAEELRQGSATLDALAKFPGLLPNTVELGIRLQAGSGRLARFYDAWLNRPPDFGLETNRVKRSAASKPFWLFLITLAVAWLFAFIGARNIPVFLEIAEEMGIEFGQHLNSVFQWFSLAIAVLLIVMIGTLLFSLRRTPEIVRRWNPFAWRQPGRPTRIANRQALAMICLHGETVPAELLANFKRLRRVLKGSFDSAPEGETDLKLDWERLAAGAIISSHEAQVLQASDSHTARAWLIRKMLDTRTVRLDVRQAIVSRSWSFIVYVILFSILILLAFTTFSFMIRVMEASNNGLMP